MPIYEFRCHDCGAKVSLFFRSMTTDATGVCTRCGSADTKRIFSSFKVRVTRPGVDQMNKAELLDGVDYKDPTSMANFFRRMGDTFQDEPNEQMEEIVGRLDHGEDVHKALELDMDSHAGHNHGPLPGLPAED
jgi:putative FmdB family regulatory protein